MRNMDRPFSSVVVDIAKLRGYCLNDRHPRGRHKARVFRSRLGLTAREAQKLEQSLLDAARSSTADFRPTEADGYGRRYVLDLQMTTPAGTATIRSSWMVRTGEDVLRLTSCYVL